MQPKQTSRNRPHEHLKGRLAQIGNEKEVQELINNALSFSKKEIYILELSWGGPADGFKIIVNSETKKIEEVVYYYSDWFVYEEEHLTFEQIADLGLFFDYLING